MKFVPSPYQQVDLSYYSGTAEAWDKLSDTFHNIIEISSFFYKISFHKDRFHQQLQHFFTLWKIFGPTEEIRWIGENMLRTVLGRAFIKSSISFDEVWQTLQREKIGTFKTDAESL